MSLNGKIVGNFGGKSDETGRLQAAAVALKVDLRPTNWAKTGSA
jgi:hypothetical protein